MNLIDRKKAEGELEAYFRSLFVDCSVDGVTYEYFDFHHECKNMRYDRLSLLMDQLSRHRYANVSRLSGKMGVVFIFALE